MRRVKNAALFCAWILLFRHPAHNSAPGSKGPQPLQQPLRVIGGQGRQQSAGGLGVGGQVLQRLKGGVRPAHMGGHIVQVAVSAGGDDAHGGKLPGAAHQGQARPLQHDGHIRACGHLVAVAQQAEAGDVGAGVDVVRRGHRLARPGVQGGHVHIHLRLLGIGAQPALDGGGQHAGAQGLCEYQYVPRPRPHVFQDPVGVNEAGDAQAVFWLIVLNGVSAGDDAAGLHRLVVAALENFPDGLQGKAVGYTQKIHGQPGHAAHGVYVAEGVCRSDLAEQIGVVHDGGEKVHRLDDGGIAGDAVDAGIVAAVIAHQQVPVRHIGQPGENFRQSTRPQLGASAGGGGHLGQGDLLCHGVHLACSG